MRFELYASQTISQCTNALKKRLQAPETKTRPALEGWTEKEGKFSIAVTSKIAWRFSRRTQLSGTFTRESGTTIIEGHVSEGVSPFWLSILAVLLIILMFIFITIDKPLFALLSLILGGFAYIPLRGDYVNSEILLIEIERTLKASPNPPKKK